MREMLNSEMERLNNNDNREVLKVKFEKELSKERDQVAKVLYEQKQRIKQQRLLERQRIEEET